MIRLSSFWFKIKNNKKLILFFLTSYILYKTFIILVLGFYYFKNGNSILINNYKVKFSFLHWAYFGESKIAYVVLGKPINSNNLIAEFFKDTKKINILKVISNCDSLNKKIYKSKDIKGNIYICKRNKFETMYFYSIDKEIFIRANNFNSSNSKIINEYKILLEGISK